MSSWGNGYDRYDVIDTNATQNNAINSNTAGPHYTVMPSTGGVSLHFFFLFAESILSIDKNIFRFPENYIQTSSTVFDSYHKLYSLESWSSATYKWCCQLEPNWNRTFIVTCIDFTILKPCNDKRKEILIIFMKKWSLEHNFW